MFQNIKVPSAYHFDLITRYYDSKTNHYYTVSGELKPVLDSIQSSLLIPRLDYMESNF